MCPRKIFLFEMARLFNVGKVSNFVQNKILHDCQQKKIQFNLDLWDGRTNG